MVRVLPTIGSALTVAVVVLSGAAVASDDSSYAPVDRPGPALRPSRADMEAAIECSGDFHSGKEAVLLTPGTGETADSHYGGGFMPALTEAGIPWCGVTVPYRAFGDLSVAGEYDAYAIRKTFAMAGNRRIAVVGQSQGGMRPRWAFRFWPDVRPMVEDHIGIAPDNQGGSGGFERAVTTLCPVIGCPDGLWHQTASSEFIKALNSRQQTFAGIDYTVVYSKTDLLVQPRDTVLDAKEGRYRRVAVQDICPAWVADHATNGTTDTVTWALIIDAITHDGPADPARIARTVCTELVNDGVGPATLPGSLSDAVLSAAIGAYEAPRRTAPAPMPCYVYATGCTSGRTEAAHRSSHH